jgi:hypothetical protein
MNDKITIYLPTLIKLCDSKDPSVRLHIKLSNVSRYSYQTESGENPDIMWLVEFFNNHDDCTYKTWAPWWWVYFASGLENVRPLVLDRTRPSPNQWVPLDLEKIVWNLQPFCPEEKRILAPTINFPSKTPKLESPVPEALYQNTLKYCKVLMNPSRCSKEEAETEEKTEIKTFSLEKLMTDPFQCNPLNSRFFKTSITIVK